MRLINRDNIIGKNIPWIWIDAINIMRKKYNFTGKFFWLSRKAIVMGKKN